MLYPKELESVIEFYKQLPGIGEKSAERLALATMNFDQEQIEKFSTDLINLQDLKKCTVCGNITNGEICSICSSDVRDQNMICVVEDFKSLIAFEKAGNFNGVYHILGGLISPVDGIGPDDINIKSLVTRTETLCNPELIIALKSNVEGETTTLYIKKIFENKKVNISRLSYGIPIGADIDYLDFMTLDRAITDRKKISE